MNHRLQIFEKDGTFVREGFVGKETAGASTWDIAFSADSDQTYIYNADGGNHLLWTVRHDSLETLGTTGRRGRMAGQFEATHSVAVDSHGNVYVGETLNGRRVQKFTPAGM
jgi:sugar lactone lactonase YvrE